MKGILFAIVAAVAPTAASDAPSVVARAYLNETALPNGMAESARTGADYCLQSGQISEAEAQLFRGRIPIYATEIAAGLPPLQKEMADAMAPNANAREWTDIATFFQSSVGRKFIANSIADMTTGLAKSLAPCPNRPPKPATENLTQSIYDRLSPAEKIEVNKFASSAGGAKFPAVISAGMNAILPKFKDLVRRAGATAGLAVGRP